jgi:hypothetical protein
LEPPRSVHSHVGEPAWDSHAAVGEEFVECSASS